MGAPFRKTHARHMQPSPSAAALEAKWGPTLREARAFPAAPPSASSSPAAPGGTAAPALAPAGASALAPAAAAIPASVPPLPAASAATCAPSLAARRGAASSDLRVYAAQFAVVCVALFLLRPPFASARRPTGEAAVSGRVVVTIAALSVVATAALARMRTPS